MNQYKVTMSTGAVLTINADDCRSDESGTLNFFRFSPDVISEFGPPFFMIAGHAWVSCRTVSPNAQIHDVQGDQAA